MLYFRKNITLLLAIGLLLQGQAQQKFVDSMIGWVKTHPKIDSQYILTLHRISYRVYETDPKTAFAYYEKVSYYSDSLNFVYGRGLAQINLGILFNLASNFDASNSAYFKAIEYAEACNAQRLKAVSLNNVGENFKVLKDFIKCRQYTMDALAINTQLKAWRGVAINYELLYRCDVDEKLYDSARLNLDRGMAFVPIAGDSTLYALFYLGYGKLHAIAGRHDSASFYFDKVIKDARQKNLPANEYDAYMAQVQYFNNIPVAVKLQILNKAMRLARITGNLERISDVAKQLSFAWAENKNKDSSLVYFNSYLHSADSVLSENNRRSVAIRETEWMVRRKEIENNRLKSVADLQHKDLSVKNNLLTVIGISFVLSIVVAFVFYHSVQNKKKLTESALKQNIAETQMQALRSQMNPHFIFNSLNSIDAYIQSNDKYHATLYLNKFAKLIRNILDSSRHNLVAFAKDIETLQLYIELEKQRVDNKFAVTVNIDPDLMNSDYKVPPLIVQPFVENAIIHGLNYKDDFSGLLDIDISKTENQIIYRITDNGIGREAAKQVNGNNNKRESHGLKISYERVRIFNHEIVPSVTITDLYSHEKPAGTSVEVKLNIE